METYEELERKMIDAVGRKRTEEIKQMAVEMQVKDTTKNKHLKDIEELDQVIKDNKDLTLKELCVKLNGHNYDSRDNYFDLNFKSLLTTVRIENGIIIQQKTGITVYDDENEIINEMSSIEEVAKL